MELESMYHEERLIKLLGLKLVGGCQNHSFHILDEKGTVVGFIEKKRIHREQQEKNKEVGYGYHMVIENDKISYNSTRPFQNDEDDFFYQFYVKENDKTKKKVLLSAHKNHLGIRVESKRLEESVFTLSPDVMYLDFKRDTYRFHKEELVVLTRVGFESTYHYQMRFCPKEKSLEKEKDTTVFDLGYKERKIGFTSSGNVLVETHLWRKDENEITRRYEKESTLEEEIITHKRGLEAFERYRKSLNDLLPFEEDIIDVMLEEYKGCHHLEGGVGSEEALFLPTLKKEPVKTLAK